VMMLERDNNVDSGVLLFYVRLRKGMVGFLSRHELFWL
jgi:hypothetical protein